MSEQQEQKRAKSILNKMFCIRTVNNESHATMDSRSSPKKTLEEKMGKFMKSKKEKKGGFASFFKKKKKNEPNIDDEIRL